MLNSKNLTIVTISTILFGLLSKWLVGVPYMAWGYFDKLFIASFILWMLYSTILYLAIKIENANYLKLGFTGVVFGLISACLKMGLDAIIEHFTKFAGNLIVTAFIMEMGILAFGSTLILVLYIHIAKKKVLWNKSMKKFTLGLGGIVGVYVTVIFYYLWQLKHWMEKFADLDMEKFADLDIIKEVGEKQGMLNLSTKYAQESTMVGMIVYVLFFIVLWIALKKKRLEKNKEC